MRISPQTAPISFRYIRYLADKFGPINQSHITFLQKYFMQLTDNVKSVLW